MLKLYDGCLNYYWTSSGNRHVASPGSAVMLVTAIAVLLIASSATLADDAAELDKAFWGIGVVDIPAEPQPVEGVAPYKFPTKVGALVVAVDPYAFGAKLGVGGMTIIDAVNGKKIADAASFVAAANAVQPGDKVVVRARLAVVVGNRPKWKGPTSLSGVAISRLKALDGQVHVELDRVRGVTNFRHVDSSEVVNDKSDVVLDVAGTPPDVFPALTIKYVAEDWLFVQGYVFVVDGQRIEVDLHGADVERDNKSTIWEWCVLKPATSADDDPTRDLLRRLASAKTASISYLGRQYRKDRDLEDDELGRIGSMWRYYVALKAGKIKP